MQKPEVQTRKETVMQHDGSLFVTEDGNGTIWRISRTRSVRSKIGPQPQLLGIMAGYKF
jgi:hypothetical protein